LVALVVTPLRQIGGHLVASDDVQRGSCGDKVRKNHRLFAKQVREHERRPVVSRVQRLVHHDGVRLDGDAIKNETLGEKIFLRRIDHFDFWSIRRNGLRCGLKLRGKNRRENNGDPLPAVFHGRNLQSTCPA